ncbi:glycosyltransferase family 1 protein [Candidatus Igneacidithiobacillus taiwanensis]|uniref:glycosyltransferase family 4 protein n=1 Tax=Candidatus Igneacidithiobacillus taiwanensis TaxID=1945924 RepID=UPI0028989967|nr:glycosyltransferase family 1 protein [Candidatus Igneacidithiobacillus taiwanensis]
MTKLLIDCTETCFSGGNTGIHRVVRSIAARRELIQSVTGMNVLLVCSAKNGFFVIDNLDNKEQINKKSKLILDLARRIYDNISFLSIDHGNSCVSGSGKMRRVRVFARSFFRRVARNLLYHFQVRNLPRDDIISVNIGDIIFLPDAFWGQEDVIKSALSAKKKGALIIPLIHDLIPVNNVEYCDPSFAKLFVRLLPLLVRNSSAIVTISKSVKTDIMDWIDRNLSEKKIQIEHFYSGADIISPNQEEGNIIRPEITQLVKERYIYLMVGSLEPRKGHSDVLDAFEVLWENKQKSYILCIVGSTGWRSEVLLKRINSHPEKNKRLFYYHNLNDSEVDFLYNNARALIFASYAEGFGLPLVEAGSHRLPVIARDIKIFREIANDWPLYFTSKKELVNRIEWVGSELFSRQSVALDACCFVKSWDDSVIDLSRIILNLFTECVRD